MKKLVIVLFCLSLTFAFGCSKAESGPAQESTESAVSVVNSVDGDAADRTTETWPEGFESENGTYPLTLPLDPEVSQSLYEASVSEEESLNEEWARWTAVDEVMRGVLNSKEFLEAETDDKKAEIVIEAMKDLSLNGTAKYPESLIIYDSWVYFPEAQEVSAKYFDGIEFFISWHDFYSESTDVTR